MDAKINASSTPCVIVGAGDVLDYGAVRAALPPGRFVICADGGHRHCAPLGLAPDLLVGDFDSLGPPPEGVARVTLSPEKNYTDSHHAVEEGVRRGFRRYILVGMLGGRLDHTLANLQLLGACAVDGLDAQITDGVTDVHALAGPGTLELAPRADCYFSLLSLVDACAGVTIRGGLYPLESYPLSSLEARAVSNEFTGVPVTVSLDSGVLLITVTPKDHAGGGAL